MAPREPYQVHSLKKHIADKKHERKEKGAVRPMAPRAMLNVKKEPSAHVNHIFGNNDDSNDDEDDSTSSSDSSDDDSGPNFLSQLNANHAAPSKRRRNDEEIADSDVERQSNSKKRSATEKNKPVKSELQSSDIERKPKVKAIGRVATKAEDTSSTSSDTSDSDSESDEESDDDKKSSVTKPQAKANATAKADDTSSSSEETSESDSDSDDSSDASEAQSKPMVNGKANGNAATSSSSSEEEDDSDSGSDSDSDAAPQTKTSVSKAADSSSTSEDEEDDDRKPMPLVARGGKKPAAPKTVAPVSVLRKSGDSANGQDVAEICRRAKEQGKEFWYFVAPSDALISVAHNLEISMDEARRGDRVVSHNGEEFGVTFNSVTPKSTIQVVLPSADISQYQSAARQPDQVMQFRRLPQVGAPVATASAVGPSPKPPARPQPEGLSARFTPIGVYDPTVKSTAISQPDVDMDDAPVVQEAPDVTPGKKNKKKEKSASKGKTDMAGDDNVLAPGSTKKRKLTPSEEDAEAAAEQLRGETQMAEKHAKKAKTDRRGSFDLGSDNHSGTSKMPTPSAPVPSVSTPASKVKSSKKSKSKNAGTTPAPPSGQKPSTSIKQTPVPLPPRQTQVPIPTFPGSSQPSFSKSSPVPAPQHAISSATNLAPTSAKSEKVNKSKGKKDKDKKSASQSPAPVKSQTPVPPPVIRGMD